MTKEQKKLVAQLTKDKAWAQLADLQEELGEVYQAALTRQRAKLSILKYFVRKKGGERWSDRGFTTLSAARGRVNDWFKYREEQVGSLEIEVVEYLPRPICTLPGTTQEAMGEAVPQNEEKIVGMSGDKTPIGR